MGKAWSALALVTVLARVSSHLDLHTHPKNTQSSCTAIAIHDTVRHHQCNHPSIMYFDGRRNHLKASSG